MGVHAPIGCALRMVSDCVSEKHQYRIVWFGLALAVVLDTVTQLCWKAAAAQIPPLDAHLSTVLTLLTMPLLYVTIVLLVLQFLNWMVVLAHADLSYAQPITALSYVTVNAASAVLFQEPLSALRFVGLTMILLGVWFISRTHHHTGGTRP